MGLKVLLVASEVSPYAKTGGLGDVMSILPTELVALGVEVKVIFPKYKSLSRVSKLSNIGKFNVNIKWKEHEAEVFKIDDKEIYAIGNTHFFMRDFLYGYEDDYARFYFFTISIYEFLKFINFKPDIIHFNDWQTGLGAFYLKENLSDEPFFENIRTVFSIHNLQYQGNFDPSILKTLDISEFYYNQEMLELYGNASFMKAAIVYNDAIATVSETYAKEIQTPQYSYGLDGIISTRKNDLYGVLNGISYDDVQGGIVKDRAYLQQRVGLPIKDTPVVALITRLVEQKGIDIIALALSEILSHDIQLVVLGTGEHKYETFFFEESGKYENLSSHIYFSTDLSNDIYKHSDMFLMPSLFEPCGLAQMISMKYGTVPIVRKTGGLEDTVHHFNVQTGQGNGFIFEDYDANGLMWAMRQALNTYNDKVAWEVVKKNAINSKFSSEESAKKYVEMYKQVIKKSKNT